MTHIALSPNGTVLAHFLFSHDAAEYCRTYGACHVPFNSDMHQVPAVGTVYKA